MRGRKEKSFEGIIIKEKETVLVDAPREHPFSDSLIQLILIEAVLYSVVFSFVTGFHLAVEPTKLIFAIFLSALISWGLFLIPKFGAAVLLPLLATYVYAGYRLWLQLENGFWHIENVFIHYMNKYYGNNAPNFLVDSYEPKTVITLFLIFSTIPIALIISLVIMDKAALVLYYPITLPIVILPLTVGLIPSTVSFAFYIAATFGMLALGSSLKRKGKSDLIKKERRQLAASRYKISLKSSFLMFVGILLLLFVVSVLYTPGTYERNTGVQKTKKSMVIKMREFKLADLADYFDFLNNGKVVIFHLSKSSGGLNEGKLGKVGKLTYDNKTDIIINALDNKETIYLKGFTGSVYDGDSWNGLSDEDLAKFADYEPMWETIGMNVGNQTGGLLQFLTVAEGYLGILGHYNYTMDIQNIGAGSKYFYAPYYTNYTGDLNPDLKNPEYIINNSEDRYYSLDYYLDAGDKNPLSQNFYSDFANYEMNLLTLTNNTAAGQLSNSISSYESVEKPYSSLIKEVYTQVPDTGLEELKTDMAGKYEEMKDRFGEDEALEALTSYIRTYIQKYTVYSLSPGTLPRNEDFIEYFLYEKKQGYCTHYASAAAMAFRIAGVPARYVEGYVAEGDTISKGKAIGSEKVTELAGNEIKSKDVTVREVRISDAGAHAWVEIYKEGWGWVPVEMTPGFQTEEDSARTDALQPTPSVTPVPSITGTPTPTPDSENDQHNGSGQNAAEKDKTTADIMLFLLIGLLSTALALLVVGILIKLFRVIRYRKAETGMRVIMVYRRVRLLFKKLRIPLENGDYEQLAWKTEEILPEMGNDSFTEFINIVTKARFGYAPMTPEELRNVRKYYRLTRRKVFGQITPIERLLYHLFLL